ncbi:phage tail protein [Nocardioides sp. STR2]|jgi:phage tail-like protein|uniref:Phage tail protein n=1 Tax=Nocardioides pini TaxID=2975053 RepID=A0ABT4CCS6_9ACTN|nr:phage tail protein [Nocardioides pini]MCY4725949.1 phage tail protein [Nocardioides pini]
MTATGARNDPYSAFNFIVEIDGVIVGGFAECGGLGTETDIVEYRNGDEDITVRKLPGKAKYPQISLKRGFTDSRELWEWRKLVITGRTQRKSGTIQLLDEARQPALKWNFREGWPSKWEGPAFNAKNNDVAIETLEIAHEGLVQA